MVRIIKPIYLFLGFVLSLLGLELLLRQRSAIRSRAIRPPGPIDASATRIVVLGDSIAHAPDLPPEQAWPALLEQHLQDGYPDRRWQVINASVSGNTTVDAYARFDEHVRAFHPHIVLIALGLNDCRQVFRAIDERRIASFYRKETYGFGGSYLYRAILNRLAPLPIADFAVDQEAEGPRVPSETFTSLLTWFINESSQIPAQSLLVSLTPVSRDIDPSRHQEFARWSEYNTLVGQTARTLRVSLIDVSQPFLDVQCWADDGIHLSATGEIEVAERVWAGLQATANNRATARVRPYFFRPLTSEL